jgi:hypothetical protein
VFVEIEQAKRLSASAPIKEANEQNPAELRLNEKVSKILGTAATRDHFRAVAQLEPQSTIYWFARDHVIQVDDSRSMYPTKVLRVEPFLELIQGNFHQI